MAMVQLHGIPVLETSCFDYKGLQNHFNHVGIERGGFFHGSVQKKGVRGDSRQRHLGTLDP